MLDALKKWIGATTQARRNWDALAGWAELRQAGFRAGSKGEGFIVDGRTGAFAWRMEWGASQRTYITGPELRLRADLRLPGELQMLLINRPLAEVLEKAVFEEYVENVQTRADTSSPPEMRWLAMFPKVPGSDLKVLRERYAAVASHRTWLLRWLDNALSDELAQAPGSASDPTVWMIGRGRLTLRTSLTFAEPDTVNPWLSLFESALRHARRAQAEFGAPEAATTLPSLWAASAIPSDSHGPLAR